MRGLLNYNIASFQSLNKYSFPEVFPYTELVDCNTWSDFDTVRTHTGQADGLHFYISDYKFNCIWENPKKYIGTLSRFKYVIQPDFSLYYDFPVALQIFNKYRNHWIYAYYCAHGVQMIPNISVSVPECWDWSFLGYPRGSVVAFSAIGALRDKSSRQVTYAGYEEMLKRLEPKQVLYFCRSPSAAPSEATVIEVPFLRRCYCV